MQAMHVIGSRTAAAIGKLCAAVDTAWLFIVVFIGMWMRDPTE